MGSKARIGGRLPLKRSTSTVVNWPVQPCAKDDEGRSVHLELDLAAFKAFRRTTAERTASARSQYSRSRQARPSTRKSTIRTYLTTG